MPIDPYAHGKYSQGGFNGKGKNRLPKQRPSKANNDGCAVTALALAGGVVGLIGTAGYGIVQIFN